MPLTAHTLFSGLDASSQADLLNCIQLPSLKVDTLADLILRAEDELGLNSPRMATGAFTYSILLELSSREQQGCPGAEYWCDHFSTMVNQALALQADALALQAQDAALADLLD